LFSVRDFLYGVFLKRIRTGRRRVGGAWLVSGLRLRGLTHLKKLLADEELGWDVGFAFLSRS
jgi:hypothetical protein